MARKGKRISSRGQVRLIAALVMIALIAGGYAWWHVRHWRPDRDAFPVQGVEIGEEDGAVDWRAIKAIGADFAYVDASAGAFARDARFVANLEEARAAKLRAGAVHRYDPCMPAEKQAGNFVTVVPRDAALMPPVVELDRLAEDCQVKVSDAAIESELTTFLNQVETHTGKPVLLKVSAAFQDRYRISAKIDRNLWLTATRFEPDYGGRPWTLWTANTAFDSSAGGGALRWVVVRP